MNPNSNSARLILILLELLIPIIGFLFWNWDFVFIILFFAIDWFVLVLFHFVKMKECTKQGLRETDKRYLALTVPIVLSSFLATISVIVFVCYTSIPNFDLKHEIIRFLSYKDSGIAQGYFLVPVCLLNGYLIYQRDFFKPKLHHNKTVQEIFSKSITVHITIFIVCSVLGTLAFFVHIDQVILLYIALAAILIGKVYFQIAKSDS